MTGTAWVIAGAYAALTIFAIAVALIVFRSTRVGFRVTTASPEEMERREGLWGAAVVAFLVVVLASTIFSIPYWSDAEANAEQTIEITGRQFAWTVDPPRIKAGVETRVVVEAADVNHAVGIYDPDDTMIKQVNVLPGVRQEMTMIFEEPGTYEILCLEYCGVDHHLMENQLEVTP